VDQPWANKLIFWCALGPTSRLGIPARRCVRRGVPRRDAVPLRRSRRAAAKVLNDVEDVRRSFRRGVRSAAADPTPARSYSPGRRPREAASVAIARATLSRSMIALKMMDISSMACSACRGGVAGRAPVVGNSTVPSARAVRQRLRTEPESGQGPPVRVSCAGRVGIGDGLRWSDGVR
jgi:hypothetical protein